MKKNKIWIIAGIIALVICLSLAAVLFIFRDKEEEKTQDPTETTTVAEPAEHTVWVKSDKGDPFEGIAVEIYDGEELKHFAKTDEEGKMTFTDLEKDTYVAKLSNVPTGYGVEDSYPLTGVNTEIVLSVGQLSEEDMESMTYKLGDLAMDFSVTAADGTVYTLYELLEEKQAVVLNFWYQDCEPCLMELPFLQEAYGEYSDRIAVLAMNPVDDLDAIAAFQAENGFTFPMAKVDEGWIKLMQISDFPTTVVIDRYGNITLMHTGAIDNAQTFRDVFEYFSAEEYEQKLIEDISELETEREVGTKENPAEIGSVTSFEVTLKPGEEYYANLFRVNNMILSLRCEDVEIIYNEKTYKPSNGTISFLLECPDMNTPVSIVIVNTSEEKKELTVQLTPKLGSVNNPYSMSLGEFTAKVSAGNEVGIYYLYTATEDGLLKMQCLEATPGIKYSYYLYNLNTYAMRNLEEDLETTEEGAQFVSVEVRKGQQVQFSVGTLPDENNQYPAGTFKMLASFDNGVEVTDPRAFNEKIDYTVTLKDQNGNAIAGASIHLSGTVIAMEATETEEAVTEAVDQYILTDENGVAILNHYPGVLEGKIRIPEGYTLENNSLSLTKEAPAVEIILDKIVYLDYTVKVNTPEGEPAEGVIVVVNGKVAYTGADKGAAFHLPEGTYAALVLGIPGEYVLQSGTYEVSAEAPELTVTLGYAPGHETNPIEIRDQASFKVQELTAGSSRYYKVYGVGNTTLNMTVNNSYILVNGTEYRPDESGKITVAMPEGDEPVIVAVFNTDTVIQNVTVGFVFPVGTRYNPIQLKAPQTAVKLSPEMKECYLYYKPAASVTNGTLSVSVTKITEDISYDVIVTNGAQTSKLSDVGGNKVGFDFVGNGQILIQVIALETLYDEVTITTKPAVSPKTGTTYSVELMDQDENPLPGVQLQFMQSGLPVGDTYTTNGSGVVEAKLPSGSYEVVLLDNTYEYDKTKATVSESKTSVTIVASRVESPVAEGMTRYNVMVTDFNSNVVGDYLILFLKDGEPVAYNIVPAAGGVTSMELETGTYDIQLAFLGAEQYYYQQSLAVVTEEASDLTIRVAAASKNPPEENWLLSQITPVPLGGVYVSLQEDVNTYFSFYPTEQGVYKISVTDPNAVLSYWGSPNYPIDYTSELTDFDGTSFTISVNTNALGQIHVVGVQGSKGCILSVVRVGDAQEDIPFEPYTVKHTPVKQTLASGLNFTYMDITKDSNAYDLVYNETDGYFHLGSKNGPVVYVQLNYNAKGENAPYVTLYDMVGGVGNTGTALRCSFTDKDGNLIREDYTAAMLSYGACADDTYGVYPVTEDLMYMIKMGGQYLGWWEKGNANSQMIFTNGENLEIAYMFAFCYIG